MLEHGFNRATKQNYTTPHCHPDRSKPIFLPVPLPVGRLACVVEGSLFTLRRAKKTLLEIQESKFPRSFSKGTCRGRGQRRFAVLGRRRECISLACEFRRQLLPDGPPARCDG